MTLGLAMLSFFFFFSFFMYLFLLKFLLVLGYSRFTHNVVAVSGDQQRDSIIPVPGSILPQTPSHPDCHTTLNTVSCAINIK